uniref:Retrovirus-related Pol polyprotein from transposon TNT 1-94 n=1 Tax=Tanacetum cinerariifolium TaxID=118510 RepID=A0A6L2JGL5_TANCI|nr:hypothetical protein [Tanacetum cinerariifolium]
MKVIKYKYCFCANICINTFDWDEESLSSEDEGTTTVKAFMAIAEDEPTVGKTNARSGQWVKIIVKNVQRLLTIDNSDETKHDEISDLKKDIEKWTSSPVFLDQLLTKQVPGNNVHALGGKGKRKDSTSSMDFVFTKAKDSPNENSHACPSDDESVNDNQEPLPDLPKLSRAEPIGTSKGSMTITLMSVNITVDVTYVVA